MRLYAVEVAERDESGEVVRNRRATSTRWLAVETDMPLWSLVTLPGALSVEPLVAVSERDLPAIASGRAPR